MFEPSAQTALLPGGAEWVDVSLTDARLFTRRLDGTRLELQRDDRWAPAYRVEKIGPGFVELHARHGVRMRSAQDLGVLDQRSDKQRLKLPHAVTQALGSEVLVVVDRSHEFLWLLRLEDALRALALSVESWPGVMARDGSGRSHVIVR